MCENCGLREAPVLCEGVTDTVATVQTGKSYQLDKLMDGEIFEDPTGAGLTYENYFYTVSSDDGATWGEVQHFEKALFGGVKNARFRRQVVPGDVLELQCRLVRRVGPVGIGEAVALVDGKPAAQAELTFAIQAPDPQN